MNLNTHTDFDSVISDRRYFILFKKYLIPLGVSLSCLLINERSDAVGVNKQMQWSSSDFSLNQAFPKYIYKAGKIRKLRLRTVSGQINPSNEKEKNKYSRIKNHLIAYVPIGCLWMNRTFTKQKQKNNKLLTQ